MTETRMDDRIARYLDRLEGRYWGKYRGVVVDRDDPEELARLKVRVPSVLGETTTGWAWPAMPYAGAGIGFFFLPQPGDLVWIEFVEGDLEHPVWVGGAWGKPGGSSELPTEAQDGYRDRYVIKTPSGSTIVIDDTDGSESVTIKSPNNCEITLDEAARTVTVTADNVVIQSSAQMAEELATKTFVEQIFDTHQHPTGVGPTGPPVVLSTTNPKSVTSVLKAE